MLIHMRIVSSFGLEVKSAMLIYAFPIQKKELSYKVQIVFLIRLTNILFIFYINNSIKCNNRTKYVSKYEHS